MAAIENMEWKPFVIAYEPREGEGRRPDQAGTGRVGKEERRRGGGMGERWSPGRTRKNENQKEILDVQQNKISKDSKSFL